MLNKVNPLLIKFCFVISCFLHFSGRSQSKSTGTRYFGVQMGYSYKRLNEVSVGGNFMLMRNWDTKTAIIHCISAEGYLLFAAKNTYPGGRINYDLISWMKNNSAAMPNLGFFVESTQK